MKKFLVAVVATIFVFALTSCQSSTASSQDSASESAQDDAYLVLVNKENKLPDDWLDQIELATTRNTLGEEFQVERVALDHYENLRYEALQQGVGIELDSTYRSPEEQEEIWAEWEKERGEDYCRQYLAVPSYSEHHTGLAIDVFIIKGGQIIRENDDMLADTEDFAKVHQLLAKHGFILRYPQGKEDITGYAYEPWHLRFVGQSAAETITSRGITLEEYLENIK